MLKLHLFTGTGLYKNDCNVSSPPSAAEFSSDSVYAEEFRYFHIYLHEIYHPDILFSATEFRRLVISMEQTHDEIPLHPGLVIALVKCAYGHTQEKK